MNKKPFFYRIDAGALIDFATDPEGENVSLLRFAKDLQKGYSEIEFIQNIIDEAHNYIESKKNAGRNGGLAKASSAKAKASSAKVYSSTPLAKASTPLASNSSSKATVITKTKNQHAEFVFLSDEEYHKLTDEHGSEKTAWMISKLNSYKGSSGKKYKSDYLAILNWVTEKAKQEFKPLQVVRNPMAGY